MDQVRHHCEQEADGGIHHARSHEKVSARRTGTTPETAASPGWSGEAAPLVSKCGKGSGVGGHVTRSGAADWGIGLNMQADPQQRAADQLQGAILEALK